MYHLFIIVKVKDERFLLSSRFVVLICSDERGFDNGSRECSTMVSYVCR